MYQDAYPDAHLDALAQQQPVARVTNDAVLLAGLESIDYQRKSYQIKAHARRWRLETPDWSRWLGSQWVLVIGTRQVSRPHGRFSRVREREEQLHEQFAGCVLSRDLTILVSFESAFLLLSVSRVRIATWPSEESKCVLWSEARMKNVIAPACGWEARIRHIT